MVLIGAQSSRVKWLREGLVQTNARQLTFCWAVEPHVELLHVVIHKIDLIVRHEPEGEENMR